MLHSQMRRVLALVAVLARRSPNNTVRTHTIGAGKLVELQSRGYVRFAGNDRWALTDSGRRLAEEARAASEPEKAIGATAR